MSSNTVAEFANELKKSPAILLDQLRAAGVAKASATDRLTEADKQRLLAYLQASHGTASGDRKKITLVKKSTTEIKQADASGKARTIQVEVRKKRTFVKREDMAETTAETTAEMGATGAGGRACPGRYGAGVCRSCGAGGAGARMGGAARKECASRPS